jgi:hypothetical protein
MVCALGDSTGTSVLGKKSRAEMLKWFDNHNDDRGDPPEQWLAPFPELLKRCKKHHKLTLEPQQIKDICRLHRYFRNDFIHFTPKGWSIEKAGLPRIIGAALNAIEQLMGQHNVLMHLEEDEQQRLANSLKSARASLGIA